MPKLLIAVVIAATLLGCSKNKDHNKLPGSLQAIIDSNKTCVCDPFINEYKWQPAGYDISQFFTEAKLIRTAWRCKPPQEY